ncbi:putative leucine-rich repeat-containing protein DDB_G0290503 isoform X2 [Ptychodera flava]|uniref:putative leucine-rich repeat-containing protein DDB_G0290503 isoform X2 n=1 Tax=Ptychodera flava TaxID=63121 RepID=UPI00396A14B0
MDVSKVATPTIVAIGLGVGTVAYMAIKRQNDDIKNAVDDIRNKFDAIEDLKSKVDEIKNQVAAIDDLNNKVEAIHDIKNEIGDIKNKVDAIEDLKIKVDEIKNQVAAIDDIKKDIDDIKIKVDAIEHLKIKVDEIKNQVAAIDGLRNKVEAIEDLKDKVDEITNQVAVLDALRNKVEAIDDIKNEIGDIKKKVDAIENLTLKVDEMVRALPQNSGVEHLALQSPTKTVDRSTLKLKSELLEYMTAPNPFFVGHEGKLRQMYESYNKNQPKDADSDPTQRRSVVHVINGPAGCGKSEIAVQYVHSYYKYYSNVLWITAGSRKTLDYVFKQMSEKLNLFGEKKDLRADVIRKQSMIG